MMALTRKLSLMICLCLVGTCLLMAPSTQVHARKPASSLKSRAGESAHALMVNGKTFLEKKRYVLAVRSFSAALRRDPNLAEAHLLRGIAYDFMGVPHAAIRDFSRYIEMRPKDPNGYMRRGDAHNFNLDHEAALSDYEAVIRLSPSSSGAHTGRGLAYAGLQKYDEAIKDYQWVLRNDPKNTETLENLGVACMLAGRNMEAMSYFERALETETDPHWRAKIQKWSEKLLKQADAIPQKNVQRLNTPAGPVKGLW
jgi:tetratricopeptide (TPR) repeat protein